MSTPEKKVKDKLVRLLKKHGVWHCFPATYGRGRSGIPDVLVCAGGWFIGIECKAVTGKLTPAQAVELDNIKAANGIAIEYRGTKEQHEALDSLLAKVKAREVSREWEEEPEPRIQMEHRALRLALTKMTGIVEQALTEDTPNLREYVTHAKELLVASDPELEAEAEADAPPPERQH